MGSHYAAIPIEPTVVLLSSNGVDASIEHLAEMPGQQKTKWINEKKRLRGK